MSIPLPGDEFLAVVQADPLVKASQKLEARARKAYDREPANSALWIAWQKAAELTLWLGSAVATRNIQAQREEAP